MEPRGDEAGTYIAPPSGRKYTLKGYLVRAHRRQGHAADIPAALALAGEWLKMDERTVCISPDWREVLTDEERAQHAANIMQGVRAGFLTQEEAVTLAREALGLQPLGEGGPQ